MGVLSGAPEGQEAMKIAVMAAGGVGGYFGARLAAVGEDVHFIARGAHLAAMKAHGLRLDSGAGNLHLKPVHATDDPATIGPVDFILFAVKNWALEPAANACKPLIGPATAAITFLNGVDSVGRLGAILGPAHVMAGAAYIGSSIASPGVIKQLGTFARLVFGEPGGGASARGERFLAACRKAGFPAELMTDITREIWAKFAMLTAMSGVLSVLRKSAGPAREDPVTRQLVVDAIAEVAAVAKAKGIDLGAQFLEQQKNLIAGVPADMKSSMQLDLERGNRLELDWLSGAVARLGDELKVPTPVHHFVYAALKLHAQGTKA
jgi:2-dehydropantoate 2-reductase